MSTLLYSVGLFVSFVSEKGANLKTYNECRLPELVANVCFSQALVLEVEGTKETGGCLFWCSRAVCFQLATSCQPPGT